MNKVYVVTMYRYSNRDTHSYVLGVYSTEKKAIDNGLTEEAHQAGKYKCEVIEFEVDNECIDYKSRTVLRLERDNPLDLDNKCYIEIKDKQ